MKKRLMNNLMLKIASVLFAVILWLVVVNEIDPITKETYSNIAVTMLHDELITNKGNTYRMVNGNTVDVTVTAKRTVLEKLNPKSIRATADIKDIQLSAFVPIKITIAGYEGSYKSAVATPNNIEIKIETSKSNRFPISIETIGTQQDGTVLGKLTARPESVEISGPMSLIGRIEKVVARVDINGISSDTTLEADLVLYDGGGNIIDQTSLQNNLGSNQKVQVRVRMLDTKAVNINLDTSGLQLADGYEISEVSCEPRQIKIAGEEYMLDSIQGITIPSELIRVGNISKKTDVTVDITEALPANVRLANENEKNVVVTIRVERAGVKSFELPVSAISKNHVMPGYKVDFGDVQVVTLDLTGDAAVLEKLTMEEIKELTFINLKDCIEEKTYRVPIRVALPDGVEFVEEPYVIVRMIKQSTEE